MIFHFHKTKVSVNLFIVLKISLASHVTLLVIVIITCTHERKSIGLPIFYIKDILSYQYCQYIQGNLPPHPLHPLRLGSFLNMALHRVIL